MHHHSRSFIDDEEVLVLEPDRQRDGLCCDAANGRGWHTNAYPFLSARYVARLLASALNDHAPVCDESRGLIARQSELPRHEEVESTGGARRPELVPFRRALVAGATHGETDSLAETSPPPPPSPVVAADARRRVSCAAFSSFQSTMASKIAPIVTAESATLNVQKRT